MTDPADLSAVEARSLIATKALSPVELVEACIKRRDQLDHAVNAIVARDDTALQEFARAAEAAVMRAEPLGALHGLPFAVKDMNDAGGLPTTFGSLAYKDNIPSADDSLVKNLRAAGGLVFGKTNVPEWSAGGNTRNLLHGASANPYDTSRSCAGSSGGSAIALACGYAPLATGSDTGGSLRNPAAYCGVVGFRPSPGVVPDPRRATALIPLATDGPMGRTVADCALLLSAMATPDARDPFTTTIDGRTLWDGFDQLAPVDLKKLRFAATPDFGIAPTEQLIRRQFDRVTDQLAPDLGGLDAASPRCEGLDQVFAVLRGLQFLGPLADLYDRSPDLVGPNVATNIHEARGFSAQDVTRALMEQGRLYRNWQRFFERYDYILSPAVTLSPRPWRELYPSEIDGVACQSYYHWLALAYAVTVVGHPAITIPCGLDENGMPFGLQIVGRRHDDLGVLKVAQMLEQRIKDSDLRVPPPKLQQLAAQAPLSASEGFLTFD
ncbi:amidase [Epibacterium sp. SM1969]|uniref:Amidase n=1 Tax=Tritonibacter aquimaris TaxID=2663379 RepID=A0A844B2A2_9RHOB|nr:amidase family protein [Tritonibacter aquimaris]MQY44221.1 amidase [Tritonibacter aquimaris]